MTPKQKANSKFLPELPKTNDEKLDRIILKILREQLFKPLIDSIPFIDDEMVFTNSKSDLIDAIRANKIIFSQGRFTGQFNSKISRTLKSLGAKWEASSGSWKILLDSLPSDVQSVVRATSAASLAMTSQVLSSLNKLTPESILMAEELNAFFATSLMVLDDKVTLSVTREEKNLPELVGTKSKRSGKIIGETRPALNKIALKQQLTPDEIQDLAARYSMNLEKSIKKFTNDQILKLRERIATNVSTGNRYETILKEIQDTYGVTQSKAKFLARQETNLMTAQIQEIKSVAVGSKGYIWTCVHGSPNHPVRPAHKILDGKYFSWNNPPVTNPKTGMRAHPGQDYNCRCRPRVIFGDYEKGK